MKAYFGATNDLGQWWDGKNWANAKPSDWLKVLAKGREANESGLHIDGVFDCPRCRRTHFIVDNHDLLCDGCANTCLEVGSDELKANIEAYREKARNYWTAGKEKDREIADRIEKRNAAWFQKESPNAML